MILRKVGFWLLVILLLVVAAGGGYVFYAQGAAAPEATEEAVVQTATVRRGSLVISASGSGTVIANQVELSFERSGVLSALLVEVGDSVKAGDILAVAVNGDSEASLTAQLSSAELSVLKAQQNLDELNTPADALTIAQAEADLAAVKEQLESLRTPSQTDLANAQLAVIEAQEAVDDSQYDLDSLSFGRGNAEQINLARANYLLAQENVDRMQEIYNNTKGDPLEDARKAQALSNLEGAKLTRNQKLAILNWYLGTPSDEEVTTAQAELAVVQAQLAQAQQALADLMNPSADDMALLEAKIVDFEAQIEDLKAGPDPDDVRMAELELENAQAQLTILQENMAEQSLVAPSDGTILSINASVDDSVGTSTLITMADLTQPMLEVFVDETDMNQIGVGYEVEVVFDALPDQTFVGKVLSVDPSLVSSGMVVAVRGVVQLDTASFAKPQTLPIGLNASIEVIGSRAENVLLVPVEALREIADDKYAIFVMENEQPTMKVVEVGLMDYTYAEIISGLNEGDVVTTGVVETSE